MAIFNKKDKNQTIKNFVTNRTFDYNRNNVRLNFTLNINNQKELMDFSALLDEAKKDVEKSILDLIGEKIK